MMAWYWWVLIIFVVLMILTKGKLLIFILEGLAEAAEFIDFGD